MKPTMIIMIFDKIKTKHISNLTHVISDPQCHQKSSEREQCGSSKSPFITPDKCLNAGCCYDDMFMDEPGLQWHSPNASLWCFSKKEAAGSGK